MLDRFFWFSSQPLPIIKGEHRLDLVALSIFIVVLISCFAMQIVGIAKQVPHKKFRYMAVATGAVALGIGIWSMHFIGMLAFQLHTHVHYDPIITGLSMLPAVLASFIALEMLSRKDVSSVELFLGGVMVGAGIGLMHYSGMAAMNMDIKLRYDPFWFAVSIVVSVLLAWFALWLRFGLRNHPHIKGLGKTLLSGTVMGGAVASMHYLAMEAAVFIGNVQTSYEPRINFELIIGITIASIFLGAMVLGGNLFLRFRALYQQLKRSEAAQKAIFDTAIDGVITIDSDGMIQSVNPSVERLFGWSAEELVDQSVCKLMPIQDTPQFDCRRVKRLGEALGKAVGNGIECIGRTKSGKQFPMRLAMGAIQFDDELRFVVFASDISEQKRIESALEREATHDSLTDLPNRRVLTMALPRMMARAERAKEYCALLFIDLDGFKQVNDTLGHDIGDELLITVAQKLKKLVRNDDLVVRLAGDEFIVVLQGLCTPNDAKTMAQRTLNSLSQPMTLSQHQVSIGASIGLAMYNGQIKVCAEQLLQQADQAMYEAKKRGKGTIAFA